MRILVVEDEMKIAQALKKGLEQERYAVDVTYSGQDGQDMAVSEDYDALILDVMLPDMNGFQVAENLRGMNVTAPILFLTAKDLVEDKIAGLDAGGDDYLTKPFDFAELLARVRALLRRPKNVTPNRLTYADLILDTTTGEVNRAGHKVVLSQKEFALLEYLMRHAERVVSKANLIAHVWDYDADVLPNTVEVYMRYLRQKIERPFKQRPSLLQTVRGFGYKLAKSEKET